MVDDIAAEVRASYPTSVVDVHASGDTHGTWDCERLTQALINLLHNAAVHTPESSPVDLRVRASRGGWLFEVEDRGPGVPPGSEEDLIRPFRRGSTAVPGTGLGLAIVRGVAEAHGGWAGVWNRPGFGATFWMEIPA